MALAERLAVAKANAAALDGADGVLAADTVVALNGESLGKADTADHARATLARLSGRTHAVFTAVALKDATGATLTRTATTTVTFRRLSAFDIHAYLESNEWRDKAGCYGIQGRAAAFCVRMEGSLSNVIGLPLGETVSLLVRLNRSAAGGEALPT